MTAPNRLVTIVPTGAANIASLMAAFTRLGATVKMAADAQDVLAADRLVVPGVGAFGAAMSQLRARGLVEALVQRWNDPRPALGICLGMQLLFDSSQESPGIDGLAIVRGGITRLPASTPRVPFFGWSDVEGAGVEGCAYFAHSFCSMATDLRGWDITRAFHDRDQGIVAAISRHDGCHLACQFHPELSGQWGMSLLERWLTASTNGNASTSSQTPSGLLKTMASGRSVRVIPCLDVRDGRVVKGVQFEALRDAGDPAVQAAAYEAQGADELVMLDVSATTSDRRTAIATVEALRRVMSIPLTVGGGIRSVEDAAALLDAGADKIAVNTAAVLRPALIGELAERFGAQCVVLAIDAKRDAGSESWHVKVRSGSQATAHEVVAWARLAEQLGAGEILLTSVDRDGTAGGYDLSLLEAVCGAVAVPVIASGGASSAAHMAEAVVAGADAVLAASIFHDGVFTVADIKRDLAVRGVRVRGITTRGAAAEQGVVSC
jgi:imidazole glycerol phosphate synthase glutamine amidotransferase subunit